MSDVTILTARDKWRGYTSSPGGTFTANPLTDSVTVSGTDVVSQFDALRTYDVRPRRRNVTLSTIAPAPPSGVTVVLGTSLSLSNLDGVYGLWTSTGLTLEIRDGGGTIMSTFTTSIVLPGTASTQFTLRLFTYGQNWFQLRLEQPDYDYLAYVSSGAVMPDPILDGGVRVGLTVLTASPYTLTQVILEDGTLLKRNYIFVIDTTFAPVLNAMYRQSIDRGDQVLFNQYAILDGNTSDLVTLTNTTLQYLNQNNRDTILITLLNVPDVIATTPPAAVIGILLPLLLSLSNIPMWIMTMFGEVNASVLEYNLQLRYSVDFYSDERQFCLDVTGKMDGFDAGTMVQNDHKTFTPLGITEVSKWLRAYLVDRDDLPIPVVTPSLFTSRLRVDAGNGQSVNINTAMGNDNTLLRNQGLFQVVGPVFSDIYMGGGQRSMLLFQTDIVTATAPSNQKRGTEMRLVLKPGTNHDTGFAELVNGFCGVFETGQTFEWYGAPGLAGRLGIWSNDGLEVTTTLCVPGTVNSLMQVGSLPTSFRCRGDAVVGYTLYTSGNNGTARGPPSLAARSAGARLVLDASVSSGVSTDTTHGIDTNEYWVTTPKTTYSLYMSTLELALQIVNATRTTRLFGPVELNSRVSSAGGTVRQAYANTLLSGSAGDGYWDVGVTSSSNDWALMHRAPNQTAVERVAVASANGAIRLAPGDGGLVVTKGAGTVSSGSVAINAAAGVITWTGVSVAAGASAQFTFNNFALSATSVVQLTPMYASAGPPQALLFDVHSRGTQQCIVRALNVSAVSILINVQLQYLVV